jgi:hypothetical protein
MRKMLVAFVAMLFASPLAASAAQTMANSPKLVLTVTEAVVVGTQTVKPGDYNFQCVTIDGREYLVVTSPRNNAEIARVPCEPKPLGSKVQASSYSTVTGPNGASVLKAVQLKGEAVAHVVAGD